MVKVISTRFLGDALETNGADGVCYTNCKEEPTTSQLNKLEREAPPQPVIRFDGIDITSTDY